MDWFDITNGFFVIMGSIAIWFDVRQIIIDQGSAGIHPNVMAFFTMWSIWDIYYYIHIDQWVSLISQIPLTLGTLAWFLLMLFYNKKNKPNEDNQTKDLF